MTEVTREQVIEAVARAIDSHAFEVQGNPHEFADAWIKATAALTAIEALGLVLVPREQKEEDNYLREALRKKAYFSFFMDGRNEHGTHLLDGGATNILNSETILETIEDQSCRIAEKIFATAERLGHEAGHVVATEWEWWEWDDGGDSSGYWGYGGVNTVLTNALHGTADEQRQAMLSSSPLYREEKE